MLTALSAFSQRIQVEAGDSVAVVPIELIRNANILFLQRDSLQAELNQAKILIIKKDSAINTGYQLNLVLQKENSIKDQRISTITSTIKEKEKEIKTVKSRSILIGYGAGAFLLLSLIF